MEFEETFHFGYTLFLVIQNLYYSLLNCMKLQTLNLSIRFHFWNLCSHCSLLVGNLLLNHFNYRKLYLCSLVWIIYLKSICCFHVHSFICFLFIFIFLILFSKFMLFELNFQSFQNFLKKSLLMHDFLVV